jgi:hypothetical protein
MSTGGSEVDEQDERLLSELYQARECLDRPPAELALKARSLLALRTLDADLAMLEYDSTQNLAEQQEVAAGMRSAEHPSGQARRLTFTADTFQIDVEVTYRHGARHLVGQVLPPRTMQVQWRSRTGAITVDTDEAGSFILEGLSPQGPSRFELHDPTGEAVGQTEWMVL